MSAGKGTFRWGSKGARDCPVPALPGGQPFPLHVPVALPEATAALYPLGLAWRCLCFLMVTGVRGEGEGVPLCCFSSCVPSSSSVTLPFLLFPAVSLSFPLHALLCLFLSPLSPPPFSPPPAPSLPLFPALCSLSLGAAFPCSPCFSLSLICPLLPLPPSPLPYFSLPHS